MTSMPGDDGARLIPVGYLRIDPRQHQVDAPSVFGDDLRALPHYDGAPITRDFEDALAHALHARFSGSRRYDLADFRTDAHATSD
jgi:hypothetical protein